MAYKIGQIRRVSSESGATYMEDLTDKIIETKVRSKSPFDPDTPSSDFYDYALSFNDGETTFQKNKTYYIRFTILRVPEGYYSRRVRESDIYINADNLEFSLGLRKSGQDSQENRDNDLELNQSFVVSPRPREDLSTLLSKRQNYLFNYATVFTPKIDGCNTLVLKLKRYSFDALQRSPLSFTQIGQDQIALSYRRWLLKKLGGGWLDSNQYRIYIDDQEDPVDQSITHEEPRISYSGDLGDVCLLNPITLPNKVLNKIGFQARPGCLIVVNRSPIRLGKSGIYEVNNGTKVYQICVTAPSGYDDSKIDAFLLDYAYNLQEQSQQQS